MIATISSGNITATLGVGDALAASASGTDIDATISGGSLTAGFSTTIDNSYMQYRYFTDGTDYFREGVRSGKFVLDKTLTSTGWSGAENTDWENLEESS